MRRLTLLSALVGLPALAAPQVGDFAPPVRLPDQHGQVRDVADEFGRHYVALAFYPKDDTSGCTKEAKSVTEYYEQLSAAGIAVYGISVDGVESKLAFCTKHALVQPMLADADKTVCAAYGTLNSGGVSNRVTFIIDPARIIRVIDKAVRTETHGADILATVERLRAEDQRNALATLNEEPIETGLGVSLRTPRGWRMTLTRGGQVITWQNPDDPTCELSMILLPAEPDTLSVDAMTARLPDNVELKLIEETRVADRPAIRLDLLDRSLEPTRYVSGVRWVHDHNDVSLSVAAPPERAAEAARLLAAVVGSIG